MSFFGGIISDKTDLYSDDNTCELFISNAFWLFFGNYSLFKENSIAIKLGEYLEIDLHDFVQFDSIENLKIDKTAKCLDIDYAQEVYNSLWEKVDRIKLPPGFEFESKGYKHRKYFLEYVNQGGLKEDIQSALNIIACNQKQGATKICLVFG